MQVKGFTERQIQVGDIAVMLHLLTALRRKGVFSLDELDALLTDAATATRQFKNPDNSAAADFIETVLIPSMSRA